MKMYDVKTLPEYHELVKQALYDMEDLIACTEHEGENEALFSNMLPLLREIADVLRKLEEAVADPECELGSGADLMFIPRMRPRAQQIPVSGLLEAINRIQKEGFGE